MKLKIQGIIKQSSVDGEGIRYVIFCQGCPHHCKGCHNPETWNPDKGYFIETDDILEEIKYDPLLDGVTFSGGEPFLQQKPLIDLAKKIKDLGLDIWCYTGYEYEEVTTEIEEIPYIDKKGNEQVKKHKHVKKTKKIVLPDTTAQIFWLKNRRPDKWRDKPADVVNDKPEDDGFLAALSGSAAEDWTDEEG